MKHINQVTDAELESSLKKGRERVLNLIFKGADEKLIEGAQFIVDMHTTELRQRKQARELTEQYRKTKEQNK